MQCGKYSPRAGFIQFHTGTERFSFKARDCLIALFSDLANNHIFFFIIYLIFSLIEIVAAVETDKLMLTIKMLSWLVQ